MRTACTMPETSRRARPSFAPRCGPLGPQGKCCLACVRSKRRDHPSCAQIERDYASTTELGTRAGYLPPIKSSVGGGATGILKAEAYSNTQGRAQSLASADWIKHFQSDKSQSAKQLGLKSKSGSADKVLKMSEIKQAEREQKIIEQRERALRAGQPKSHRVKGESKAEWEREKRMASSEWEADEAQVHDSFFTEGKQVEFLMDFTDYTSICNPKHCVTIMSPIAVARWPIWL